MTDAPVPPAYFVDLFIIFKIYLAALGFCWGTGHSRSLAVAWGSSSLPREGAQVPAFGAWSLTHWTFREVPPSLFQRQEAPLQERQRPQPRCCWAPLLSGFPGPYPEATQGELSGRRPPRPVRSEDPGWLGTHTHLAPHTHKSIPDALLSPGQNTGGGSLSLLQGIFPTQGSNPGLPHCGQILYQLSHRGSPRICGVGSLSRLQGSSRPRNRTGVSCMAGRFFTN